MEAHCAELNKLLLGAVGKNLPKEKIALLFSGGIDSTLLAALLKRAGADFTCYTTAAEGIAQASDLEAAKMAAKNVGAELRVAKISLGEIEEILPKVAAIIGQARLRTGTPRAVHSTAHPRPSGSATPQVVHAGVALTVYFALRQASADGARVAFTGMGADELFGGYAEFRKCGAARKECEKFLQRLYDVDFPRDKAIAGEFGIEIKTPYLDKDVVDFALSLPEECRIDKKTLANKIVLREVAMRLGVGKEVAQRAKKAAQYGSGIDRAIEKIAKMKKFKSKTEYVQAMGKS